MLIIDLSKSPTLSEPWLSAFAHRYAILAPGATALEVINHGVSAWDHCWLLDPDEAAELWRAAMLTQRRMRQMD